MGVSVDRTLDCLGFFCPVPILKTRDALRTMGLGQVLEMRTDDPASEADMKRWTTRTGQELLEIGRDGAVFRFVVRKTR